MLVLLVLGVCAPDPASAAVDVATVDGSSLGLWWVLPFAGLLLSVAVVPQLYAYNPKKIKTPPTSWEDMWNPEYKGRVGITGLASSLGTAFMVEIAKLHGGSETNIEPAFEAIGC